MAAVYSETVTENPYFPIMRRGDERRESSPRYRHASNNSRPSPPSPQPRAPNEVPYRSATESYDRQQHRSRPSTGSSSQDDAQSRQAFASQQHFDPRSQPATYQQQSARNNYTSQHDGAPLASPADSSSPGPRSAWSSDDISRYGGHTIKVRDLAHIQSFATEEFLSYTTPEYRHHGRDPTPKYEISGMPIADIIEMVAGLLTKITTTNDRQHEHLHRHLPPQEQGGSMTGLTASVLAFHGKNVPSITILSYLSRIHKYCPLTYEVFLSLLVYFDRMTERVNAGPFEDIQARSTMETPSSAHESATSSAGTPAHEHENMERAGTPMSGVSRRESMEDVARAHYATPPDEEGQRPQHILSHFFVVDSFNIHRLVIAGVTCASKFFSDTFYTNSRYAKVGGLPLAELNHLELQFLLLNDFRLAVPVEELEAYGTMLVEFYAREVVAQRQSQQGQRQGTLGDVADMAYADDER